MLLALSLLAASGCDSGGLSLLSGVGSGSSTGTGSTSQALAGTWRRTLVVQTATDVITSETTWMFSAGGGCQRTVVSNSVLQDVPTTQYSPCSYSVAGGVATIHFDGTSGTVAFSVLVSGGKLFLGGVEFQKIG